MDEYRHGQKMDRWIDKLKGRYMDKLKNRQKSVT